MLDWENSWEELLPRLREHHGKTWQKVIDALEPQLLVFAQRFVGSRATAEDIVQNAFLDILRRVEAGTVVETKSYFFKRVQWTALQHLRDERRKRMSPNNAGAGDDETGSLVSNVPSHEPHPLAVLITDELLRSVQYGELVRLHVLENMTFAEIGESLGWPLRTAHYRYLGALRQLREKLEEDGIT